jgi:uncharacterized protein (DUF1697 family)
MTTYVALLRGINVGGKKPVLMADLRKMAEDLGFENVRTLLQSGNLLFDTDGASEEGLERILEDAALNVLGLGTDFMVRDGKALLRAVQSNPYPEAARNDAGHLVLAFLKAAPKAGAIDSLRRAISDNEMVELRRRELYIVYPDGIGRSKLTTALMDRHLAVRGTGRNWNTVLKLADLAGA